LKLLLIESTEHGEQAENNATKQEPENTKCKEGACGSSGNKGKAVRNMVIVVVGTWLLLLLKHGYCCCWNMVIVVVGTWLLLLLEHGSCCCWNMIIVVVET